MHQCKAADVTAVSGMAGTHAVTLTLTRDASNEVRTLGRLPTGKSGPPTRLGIADCFGVFVVRIWSW
jgi:hypothetical protein